MLRVLDLDIPHCPILIRIAEASGRAFLFLSRHSSIVVRDSVGITRHDTRWGTEPIEVCGAFSATVPAFGAWAENVEEEGLAAAVGVALTLALGMERKYDVVFLVAERGERKKQEGGGNCGTMQSTYPTRKVFKLSTVAIACGEATADCTVVRAKKVTPAAAVGAGIAAIVDSGDGGDGGQEGCCNSGNVHFELIDWSWVI